VRLQERRTQQYSTCQNKLSLSKRLARQSYLYVGALYITYIPVIVTRLTQLLSGVTYYGMILTIAVTIPLQGFWNLLVYLRPRYLKARSRRRTTSSGNGSFFRAVSEAVREGDLDEEDGSTQDVSLHSVASGNVEHVDKSESNGVKEEEAAIENGIDNYVNGKESSYASSSDTEGATQLDTY